MFDIYITLGFVFYETRDGKIYISNVGDMIYKNGLDMLEDCLSACDLYNSGIKKNPESSLT